MFYSIDRIESETVVLIDDAGTTVLADIAMFETEPKEGQAVWFADGVYIYDAYETEERRAVANELLKKLLDAGK